MQNELHEKVSAIRAAKSLGCEGAHLDANGQWMPCSSTAELIRLSVKRDDPTKILPSDIEEWQSRRKIKGQKKKKKFEKLRERGVLGIDTLPGGGLVSAPISMSSAIDENIQEKAVIAPMSPRDTDVDVFTDIESARARSRQLGCIGVSRRVSRSGKTVWMPCTNMSDYARVSGSTALGRRYQQSQRTREIQGAVRTVLTNRGLTRKKSITEEIQGKALGRNLKRGANFATARFDPKAIDGDNDGLVQEGTAFERPNINIPNVPSMGNVIAPKQRTALDIDNWYKSLSEKEKQDRFGPPLEAMAKMKPEDASTVIREIATSGFRSEKGPSINNPKATARNPFADLGGRAMGAIILDRVKAEHRNKQNPTTYFIGGTVGAGKDTVVNHLQTIGVIPKDDEAARIDPDFIKAGLPGYNDGKGAGMVHQQSRTATDYVMKDATSQGMDVIVLGTGKREEHPASQKRAGHRVVAHFVYAPTDVADARLRQRNSAGGRQISAMSAQIAGEIPFHISRMLDQNSLDEFYLWDNSGDMSKGFVPKLIAEKKPGKPLKIYDRTKFEDFAGGKKWADQWETKFNANDANIQSNINAPEGLSSAKGKIRKMTPKADPDQMSGSIYQAVSEVVPKNEEELLYMLKTNPYTKGRRGKRAAKLISGMQIDWEKQEALQARFIDILQSSPVMVEMVKKFGLPPIVATEQSIGMDPVFIGDIRVRPYWGGTQALYNLRDGFIAIKPDILEPNMTTTGVGGVRRTIDYVLRHELGHAFASMALRDKETRKINEKAMKEYMKRLKRWADFLSPEERENIGFGSGGTKIPTELIGNELALAKEISEYATVNRGEYIAEAFAHWSGPQNEGLTRLRNEHLEMLADFLNIDINEIKLMYIGR